MQMLHEMIVKISTQSRKQLDEALAVARAAEVLATEVQATRVLQIALDIKPLAGDANQLQESAVLNRPFGKTMQIDTA